MIWFNYIAQDKFQESFLGNTMINLRVPLEQGVY
jgi:hypothetical protein